MESKKTIGKKINEIRQLLEKIKSANLYLYSQDKKDKALVNMEMSEET